MTIIDCCLFLFTWSNLWAFITALATIVLACIAYVQIKDLNNTARQEFLHKLKEGFFTKETRDLITLIESKSLVFIKDKEIKNFGIFKVNVSEALKKYLKFSIDINREYYTTQEIDDFLLGHLEDAGLLLRKEFINKDDAYQQFEYYVSLVFKDKEIESYIGWAKKEDGSDIYSNLKFIYKELKDHKDYTSKNKAS